MLSFGQEPIQGFPIRLVLHRRLPSVARRRVRYARPRREHLLNDGAKRSGRTNPVNLVVQKGTPYCRPSKRVSSKTPRTRSEMSKSQYRSKVAQKSSVGRGKE